LKKRRCAVEEGKKRRGGEEGGTVGREKERHPNIRSKRHSNQIRNASRNPSKIQCIKEKERGKRKGTTFPACSCRKTR